MRIIVVWSVEFFFMGGELRVLVDFEERSQLCAFEDEGTVHKSQMVSIRFPESNTGVCIDGQFPSTRYWIGHLSCTA